MTQDRGFSPGALLDAPAFLEQWRDQRARRTGVVLAKVSLGLLAVGALVDVLHGSLYVLAGTLIAALGCIVSLVATQRRDNRRFVWLPAYIAVWIETLAQIFESGGLHSPFLPVLLPLYFVAGIVIQSRVSPWLFLGFVALNLLGWVAIDALLPHLVVRSLAADSSSIVTLSLYIGALLACIAMLLKTETALAGEVVNASVGLAEANVRLSQASVTNAAKNAFIANISHEIRTPLNAIVGFSELLARDELDAEERARFAGIISRNSQHLVTLVSDILDYARVEAGRLAIAPSAFDLVAAISDVLDRHRGEAERKGFALNVSVSSDFPSRIVSDPVRVQQIVSTLVGNAVKFTSAGTVAVELRTQLIGKATAVAVVVRDTGCGMDEVARRQLFRPFQQADVSLTRSHGGVGLGLALSRRLARLLGGDLTLTASDVGVGSEFSLVVATRLDQALPDVDHVDTQRLEGLRVLVAEDDADLRRSLGAAVTAAGGSVDTAADGRQAVQKALEGAYDVVVMDVQMPTMNGFDATLALRESGYHHPVLALTPASDPRDRARCLAAGCDDFLPKPVNNNHLLERLATLAGR